MKIKRILIMCIALIMCLNTVTLANGLTKNIDAVFNSINLTVNGSPVYADNILYNGTTYVPLRKASEMLGCTVDWDAATRTASINKPANSENEEIGGIFWAIYKGNRITSLIDNILGISDYTFSYSHWAQPRYSNNESNFDYLTEYYNWVTEEKDYLDKNKEYIYSILEDKTTKENIDNFYYYINKTYDN